MVNKKSVGLDRIRGVREGGVSAIGKVRRIGTCRLDVGGAADSASRLRLSPPRLYL